MAITTAEELLRAQDIGRCELVRGELRMLPWSTLERGRLASRIGGRLAGFVESRGAGTVAGSCGFVVARGPDTVRAPDVAFVRAGRVTRPHGGYVEGAPDLAVEILSPENPAAEVREKIADWLEAGAVAAWVVDPDSRTVTVYRPRAKPQVLGDGDVLRGESALEGFEVGVREVLAR
jgi:Uma2 family endonuclease